MNQQLKTLYKVQSLLTALLLLPLTVSCTNPSNVKDSNLPTDQKIKTNPHIKSATLTTNNIKTQPNTEIKKSTKLNSKPITNLNCKQVDKKLAHSLKNSFDNSGYNWDEKQPTDWDAVELANTLTKQILTNYTKKIDSIECNFPLASKEGLSFKTSNDNRFRVYSWDENTGGTMHFYSSLVQYINDNGQSQAIFESSGNSEQNEPVVSLVDGAVIDLAISGSVQQPIYILASHSSGSSRDKGITIKLFQIKEDTLINPKLIQTRSQLTDEISFIYDATSLYDNDIKGKLFRFDKASNSFSFPVVVASDTYFSGEVTNKRIRYTFDGQYFQRVKN